MMRLMKKFALALKAPWARGIPKMEANNTTRPHPNALYFGNVLTLGLYPTQKRM
jgi:hypothetical protein